MNYSNPQKAEISFLLNSFKKPKESSGYEAWSRLIISLMLTEPGTYPSDPNIGCGLNYELFKNIDYIKNIILPKIKDQVNVYLEDIPFSDIDVEEDDLDENILIFYLNFIDDAGKIKTVVVASKIVERQIDYTILI